MKDRSDRHLCREGRCGQPFHRPLDIAKPGVNCPPLYSCKFDIPATTSASDSQSTSIRVIDPILGSLPCVTVLTFASTKASDDLKRSVGRTNTSSPAFTADEAPFRMIGVVVRSIGGWFESSAGCTPTIPDDAASEAGEVGVTPILVSVSARIPAAVCPAPACSEPQILHVT